MGLCKVKLLRVLDKENNEKLALFDENLDAIGTYTTIKFINTEKTKGFLAGTNTGLLVIYACEGAQKVVERIPLHQGAINDIKVTPDGCKVITTGDDGCIFILKLSDRTWIPKEKDKEKQFYSKRNTNNNDGADKKKKEKKVVDSELAGVVLVHRDVVNDW
jgi:WD40 repeat protein